MFQSWQAWGLVLGGFFASPSAFAQCALQPTYPLPSRNGELRALADRLDTLAQSPGCVADANFHAWRGAVLMSLGRPADAIAPLERAIMAEPRLFGAQLDLAQAHAALGDRASAAALLEDLRQRAEVPGAFRSQLEREIGVLLDARRPPEVGADRWQTTWRLSLLGGYDSNLNNAPSTTEITLTLPQGDVTLPLDPASQPREGAAVLTGAQWQASRAHGESLWVVQADLRARHTAQGATGYQQSDVAANWLQAPLAASQWVGRIGASYFRFGGSTVLWATRGSLQYQWEGLSRSFGGVEVSCRPSAGAELERRLYPSSRSLDGYYRGATAGVLCRPATTEPLAPTVFSLQARLGQEDPFDAARAGGVYRREELRGHWEGRTPWAGGDYALRWSTTRQIDSAPYSVLLGNVARRTSRHTFQLETSWPLRQGLSLIGNLEAARQTSNLAAFESRQLTVYFGLRWDAM